MTVPVPDLDARLTRWRGSLNAQDLWPETTRPARIAAYRDIRGATVAALAGQPARLHTPDAEARALGIAAFLTGMGPLLGHWIERGTLAAGPAVGTVLAEHLAHNRRRSAFLVSQLERIAAALRGSQIEPVVLKGGYTAHRYFPEPGARPAADIDLLVPADRAPLSATVLGALGFQLEATHAQPHREDWAPTPRTTMHSIELGHADNPWTVDIHHTLDRGYFPGLVAGLGSPAPDALETWAAPFGPIRVLRQPWLLAHLALSASSDLPDIPLLRGVELVMLLRADRATGRLDWGGLSDLLARTGTHRFAFPAFALAEALAPGVVDPALREALNAAATPRLRRTVARCVGALPYHATRRSIEEGLAWSRGPWQLARNLLSMAYPTGAGVSPAVRLRILRRRWSLLVRDRLRWRGTGDAS